MIVTKGIARAIKAACRKACGGKRDVSIGQRSWPHMNFPVANDGINFLLWKEDHDLADQWKPDELVGQEIDDSDGWLALDCYCYQDETDGELDCNVYVLIDPSGKIVYAAQEDLGHTAAINEILVAAGHCGYIYTD